MLKFVLSIKTRDDATSKGLELVKATKGPNKATVASNEMREFSIDSFCATSDSSYIEEEHRNAQLQSKTRFLFSLSFLETTVTGD